MHIYEDDFIKEKIIRERITQIKNKKEEVSNYAISRILNSVYDYRIKGGEDKSKHEKENGYYEYIPFSRKRFIRILIDLQKEHNCKNFIDVGSGIGDKVILAELFGNFERVTGIELNTTTYHVAKYFLEKGMLNFQKNSDYFKDTKKLIKKTDRILINMDAFDYNFSEDDFIYLYVPIHDEKIMSELHKKIVLEMPIGGIIIDVGLMIGLEKVIERLDKVRIYKEKKVYAVNYFKKISENSFRALNVRMF